MDEKRGKDEKHADRVYRLKQSSLQITVDDVSLLKLPEDLKAFIREIVQLTREDKLGLNSSQLLNDIALLHPDEIEEIITAVEVVIDPSHKKQERQVVKNQFNLYMGPSPLEKPKSRISFNNVIGLPKKNDFFVGREKQISDITKVFSDNASTSCMQCVIGLGGVGKSQLLLELTHQLKKSQKYDNIIWLKGNILDLCFQKLSRELEMDVAENIATTVQQVYRKLLSEFSRSLFVFDNVGNEHETSRYLPSEHSDFGVYHILISSRSQDWLRKPHHYTLTSFSDETSVRYISSYCPSITLDDATLLATTLMNFPLLLSQALGYLKTTGASAKEYIQEYNNNLTSRRELFSENVLGKENTTLFEDEAQQSIYYTWTMSIKHIISSTPELKETLLTIVYVCAYVNSTDIPISLIKTTTGKSIIQLRKILRSLSDYSLITNLGAIHFDTHDLVQEVTRMYLIESLGSSLLPVYHEKLFTSIDGQISVPKRTLETFLASVELLPHAAKFLANAKTCVERLARYGSFIRKFAMSYYRSGNIEPGIGLLKSLLSNPPPSLDLAVTASVKRSLGRLYGVNEQHELQKQFLLEAKECFTPNDPSNELECAKTMGYLSNAFGGLGDYEEQYRLAKEALEIYQRCAISRPIHVAKIQLRLGNAAAQLHRPEEQMRLLELILPIYTEYYGSDHPKIIGILNSLGYAYGSLHQQGLSSEDGSSYLDKSEASVKSALKIAKAVYGPKAMPTALIFIHIGEIYSELKKYEEGFKKCKKAVDSLKVTCGNLHSTYAWSLIFLAKAYGHLFQNHKKRELLNKCLEIIEAIMGPDETYTLALHHLDEIDDPTDNQVKLSKMQRLLFFRQKKFGNNHELTVYIENAIQRTTNSN